MFLGMEQLWIVTRLGANLVVGIQVESGREGYMEPVSWETEGLGLLEQQNPSGR